MSCTPMPVGSGSSARAHANRCAWFWVWVVVGAALAVGLISLGTLVLVPAVLVGLVVRRSAAARRSGWGLLTGAGLTLLWVAFENRAGPGTTCYRTLTAAGCDQHLNPIPWLAIGLGLTGWGLAAQWRSARHGGWQSPQGRM
ncbi:MAG TPA: hypothetical protein VG321_12005 [Solirubrobacteraceae bacterium]|nr:hypothetical protein [Solirubrobacteraceae bacterium]